MKKNIQLVMLCALIGATTTALGLSDRLRSIKSAIRSAVGMNGASNDITIPSNLRSDIEPLIKSMLLGTSNQKPQEYAKMIISRLLKEIKSSGLNEQTKQYLEKIKGIMKRCSGSTTVFYGWYELQNDEFRKILSQGLLNKVDTQFDRNTFSARLAA